MPVREGPREGLVWVIGKCPGCETQVKAVMRPKQRAGKGMICEGCGRLCHLYSSGETLLDMLHRGEVPWSRRAQGDAEARGG